MRVHPPVHHSSLLKPRRDLNALPVVDKGNRRHFAASLCRPEGRDEFRLRLIGAQRKLLAIRFTRTTVVHPSFAEHFELPLVVQCAGSGPCRPAALVCHKIQELLSPLARQLLRPDRLTGGGDVGVSLEVPNLAELAQTLRVLKMCSSPQDGTIPSGGDGIGAA